MKDEENRIVALDFGGYSFLPPSFAFALKYENYSRYCSYRLCRSGIRFQTK